MKIVVTVIFVALLFPSCRNSEERLIKQADRIHSSILTVDTHCDTPMSFSDPDFDLGIRSNDGCV